MPRALNRNFFDRDPDVVARALLETVIVVRSPAGEVRARLVETEAYGGLSDPASHAYGGPTPRSAIMFGRAGHLYVYRSYGLHWCANVVTEGVDQPSAVLLRAAVELAPSPGKALRGPGNLTKGLGVTGADNGLDCCGRGPRRVSFYPMTGDDRFEVASSPRVGLSKAIERPSRYFLLGHPAVSKARATHAAKTTDPR